MIQLLLDSSFALLALPVSSAARGIVAVRAPRLSRCTLVQSLLSMFSRRQPSALCDGFTSTPAAGSSPRQRGAGRQPRRGSGLAPILNLKDNSSHS